MERSALFDGQPDWLGHSLILSGRSCDQVELLLPIGRLIRLDTGILQFEPDQPNDGRPGLILSAGIHGNETAPIELLDRLVSRILSGELQPRIPLLLILGSPPAMMVGQRFIEYNLNRLFRGAWQDYPDSYERQRAAQLEAACQAFGNRFPGPLRHYDLHTAIRPSRREKFALYPFVDGRQIPDTERAFLVEAGIGTLLLQHKVSTTFSAFTSEQLGAESFTLELGKVHPFGQNDPDRTRRLEAALTRLIEGKATPENNDSAAPETFEVVHEILNTGKGFRFYIDDDVANFTEYPPGTVIWEDDQTDYRVSDRPEAIIFPNRNVPVGHRVGLMIRSLS